MTRTALLLAAVFVPMLLEARRSRRNERRLRVAGAHEAARDVYPLMQVAYPACFLAMIAEGWARQAPTDAWTVGGAAVFGAAKTLKYWAIASLGPRWTFRVLVVPGARLVADGPYRWLRHPNYAGVLGEIAGVALMACAPLAGPASLAGFGALIAARIRVEERALEACER